MDEEVRRQLALDGTLVDASGDDPTLAAGDVPRPSAAPVRAAIPTRIGRYVVIAPIGEGGMGLVFSAYDPELDRKVAVKLVRPALRGSSGSGSGDPHRRLLREAQALAKLSHPNIIHVYEVGALDDEVFIAMEYFEGPTLKRWQDRAHVSWREILAIYRAAGRGLEAAHAAGLVHRDFKADNVLVGDDGQVRVIDFGLAREAASLPLATQLSEHGGASLEHLTMTGAIMGTPAYMAPEQHAGGKVDARTDQFSFCVSLYEALYGERPFAGETLPELTANVMAGTIQPPPRFERVPPWLRRALLRGLAVNPDDRYPDIAQLLTELGRDPARRRRRLLLGAAGLAVVLLGGLAWDRVSQAQQARAEGERLRVEFGRARATNAEDELRRLRSRTAAQRWDDLVLAWANEQIETDPTRALASLRHLQDLDANLGAARTIAADAWQRGIARESIGLPGRVRELGVTRAGDFAAILDRDGVVHGWSRDGDEQPRSWACPERARVLAVARGSAMFAVGTDSGAIYLIDPAADPAADELTPFIAHDGPVHALAFSADDSTLASAGADHAVRRWNAATHERIDAMTNHDAAVVGLSYDLDGGALASASVSGQLLWWDPPTGKVLKADPHDTAVRSITAAGGIVWSVAGDGRVQRWRPGSLPRATQLEHVEAVRATAEGGVVAVHEDGSVSWFDGDPDVPLRRLTVGAPVTHVAHSSRDGGIWLAGPELGVQRWDAMPDYAQALPFEQTAGALSFSPDGSLLVIAGVGGTLRVAGPELGEHALEVELAGRPVSARCSPSGDQVAVQLLDGSVQVIDTRAPTPPSLVLEGMSERELQPHGASDTTTHAEPAWTADGRALAVARCLYVDGCEVLVVDAQSGELHGLVVRTAYTSTLEPDPEGELVLIAGRDSPTVAVLDVDTGELANTSFGEGERVLGQAWADDGDGRVRIATARDGTLSVWSWQPASGRRHRVLEEPGFTELLPSDDGRALYLNSGDKLAVLWSIAGTRFSPVPELPAALDSIRIADDGLTLLARDRDLDAGGFGFVLDLANSQGRRLPRLLDPVALSVGGVVADYRYDVGVRVWDEPTPEDAAGFRAWLEQATTVVVPAEALREGVDDPHDRAD